MFTPVRFRLRHSTFARTVVLSALLLIVALAMIKGVAYRSHASNHKRQQLTFEDRVAAQRAIEEVYHRHRLWPKDNPQPKPPLDQMMPDAAIRAKVEDYLRKSTALEVYWQRALTPDELQAEMERQARQSKQPEVLRELWAALGDDPRLVAECLARPLLADRLLRERYAADERFHGESRRRAEAELNWPDAAHRLREMSGEYREVEWRLVEDAAQREVTARDGGVTLQPAEWRVQMERLRRMFDSASDGVRSPAFRRKGLVNEPLPPEGGTLNAVSPRLLPLGQMSALQEDEERRYAAAVLEQSARRVKVAMVEWRKTAFDEWWGRVKWEMAMEVVAASGEYWLLEIEAQPSPCLTDGWTVTSTTGAPRARSEHTAVWTGSEMIIWGGRVPIPNDFDFTLNTGGRYNPATNTWIDTSTTGAPGPRYAHKAVWTGSEMIVWGGRPATTSSESTATGGRYNPITDTWTATSTTGAPSAREGHEAKWTGSKMIVWGGYDGNSTNTGGQYNPATNTWIATSTTGAPSPRYAHTAVWTGSEMIIWGGVSGNNRLNTGGRYNPTADTWVLTSTTDAPSARDSHTAVWAGSEMIAWGGYDGNSAVNTGGRYNPVTNTWTAISATGAPSGRVAHAAVWTGSEMIVWGGFDRLNTGGRYNPAANTWTVTSTTGAPSGRRDHTSVWTGNAMIVWGGSAEYDSTPFSTGASYSTVALILFPISQSFPASGGSGSINVIAPGSCTWMASSNANWLTITSATSGSGNGTINYMVAANNTGSARTGTLTIGPQTFTVMQASVNCSYTLTPTSQSFNPFGGNGSVSVIAESFCTWTANVSPGGANWITIMSGSSGTGNGTVNYTIAANPSANSRSGTLTIAGQTFTINQNGIAHANDVGVAGFELPNTVGVNAPTTIRVRVTNFGSNPQSNFPISYQVGNQAPVTETFTDTLVPLQTATKAFAAAWTPTEPGPYQITARTNLNGDGDATNDSAQTTVQAVRAQYRGSWQGTTGQGLMIRFNVDEQDRVVNLEADYRISFPGTGTCVYRLCGSTAPISNGQFQTGLGCGGLGFVSGESPVLRGTFSSTTAVTGNISDFRVGFATCGGSVIFGSVSVSGSSFSAQRQVLCPTTSGINPSGGTVGANVTITGTNLTDVTAVKFANNVTANFAIVSDTQITARVPAGAATGPITLSKAGCADVQTAAFTVQPSPTPTLTNLNPASATAGGAAFTLTVNGTNFTGGSVVRWNGADRTTSFVSNTQLTAAIPAADIAAAGAASVTVFNPAPGGGVSNALSFTVNAALANVSAASFLGAELAAESIVAAFGVGLATRTEVAGGLPLPTELAGTTVEVRDIAGTARRAALFFVAPTQVNYQMPPMTASGAATVTIRSGDGKVSTGTARIAAVAPSLFTANSTGEGVAAAVALRVRSDGSQSYEPVARFDTATGRFVPVPIDLGPATDQVFLILYGTGFRKPSALSAVTCRIGGTNAAVLFAGGVEGLVGLDQSNANIPRSLIGRGEVDVVLTVDGKEANTVRISVR